MTLSTLPRHERRTAFMSSATSSQQPSLTMERFMTMSISSAPFATASAASKAFAAVDIYPFGKPMTVHIFILSPT